MVTPEAVFRSQALCTARNYRGLKVSELAEQSGVSRQVVSSLENGRWSPTPRTPAVRALAGVLLFPEEFFFSDVTAPERTALHFRGSLSRVPEWAVAQALARAALLANVSRGFQSLIKFAPAKLPNARVQSFEDVEHAAESFRKSINIGVDAPIANAVRAGEAAGVFVGTFDSVDIPIDGFACSEGVLVVMLNVAAPWSRRRFSAMHEIGHLVMHKAALPDDGEEQANRFAGAALCPRGAFWREFPRPTNGMFDWARLVAMKERWGVSIQALIHRAFDLSIITPAQYRTGCIHIRQYGWRTDEPGEQAAEEPTVCKSLASEFARRGLIGALCKATSIYVENLEEVLGVRLEQEVERTGVVHLLPRAPQS